MQDDILASSATDSAACRDVLTLAELPEAAEGLPASLSAALLEEEAAALCGIAAANRTDAVQR